MSLLSSKLTLADFSVVSTPSPDASAFLNHYNVTASNTNSVLIIGVLQDILVKSSNTGYDFDVHGGVVLYAADDLDARGLYAAADDIRGGPLAFRFASRAAAGDHAGPAASTALAPAGRFARVRRILRSVGQRLHRFLPK
ncbi:hypothetical protein B0H15DRAFT_951185 [Mycena belliarum]|uniref:Uncharacterized protein n=1 Tax=Mycena belliarum TaxID=1033014 RepID=A0AAD6XKL4_9AGAR|nr:hypothetical protein B0H15DRAFT_951185 [Mycena belliae]